ncbi:MAG: hypothetical protein ACOH2E_07915 [Candidatus Paracaedibacter sp.]
MSAFMGGVGFIRVRSFNMEYQSVLLQRRYAKWGSQATQEPRQVSSWWLKVAWLPHVL